MSEEIFGIIETDVYFGRALLFFTTERVVVAKIGTLKSFLVGGALGVAIKKHKGVKKYEQLGDVPPEDILGNDKNNFEIRYDKITSVEMKKPSMLLRGYISLSTLEKEYKFWMTKKKEFKDQLKLVRSVLPVKI